MLAMRSPSWRQKIAGRQVLKGSEGSRELLKSLSVEVQRVSPQDLVASNLRSVREPASDALFHILRFEARWVWEVRLEEDVVDSDRFDLPRLKLLEPVVDVHLTSEE